MNETSKDKRSFLNIQPLKESEFSLSDLPPEALLARPKSRRIENAF